MKAVSVSCRFCAGVQYRFDDNPENWGTFFSDAKIHIKNPEHNSAYLLWKLGENDGTGT